jgi:hypothetical protein
MSREGFLNLNELIDMYNTATWQLESIQKNENQDLKKNELAKIAGEYHKLIEFSAKYKLFKELDNKVSEGLKLQSEVDEIKKNILNGNINPHKILRTLGINPNNKGIDTDLFINYGDVRNDPEHNYFFENVEFETVYYIALELKKQMEYYLDLKRDELTCINIDIEVSNVADWNKLYSECDGFRKEENSYVLVIGKVNNMDYKSLSPLFNIDWSLIIDFNNTSKENGLYKSYHELYSKEPNLLSTYSRSNVIKQNSNSPYWIFPYDVINSGGKKKLSDIWLDNLEKMENIIKNYHTEFTKPCKIIILSSLEESDIIEDLRRCFFKCYRDNLKSFTLHKKKYVTGSISRCGNIDYLELPLNTFVTLCDERLESVTKSINETKYQINSSTGISYISVQDYLSYTENFDILYNGIEHDIEYKQEESEFLRGEKITWYGLSNSYDVKRDKLVNKYVEDIKSFYGPSKTLYLRHLPGAGGTTLAMRIIWELYDLDKFLILKINTDDSQLRDKLFKIQRKALITTIVLCESSVISEESIKRLEEYMHNKKIPMIFLYVQRNYESSTQQFELGPISQKEERRMIDKLVRVIDGNYSEEEAKRKKNILYKTNSELKGDDKIPFLLSLAVFEDDFYGLDDYLKRFIKALNLNGDAKLCLLYLAISDYYANKELDSQFIFDTFKKTSKRVKSMNDIFGNFKWKPLINVEKSNNGRIIKYSIKNGFFAKKIIEIILGGNNWRNNLFDYILKFIENTKNTTPKSKEKNELFHRLFINRYDSQTERFSRLLEDISVGGKKEHIKSIFEKLNDVYPDEAHYLAHLARYYNYFQNQNGNEVAKKYALAAIEINEGKSIDERQGDGSLYHILGSCYKQEIIHELNKFEQSNNSFNEKDLSELEYIIRPKTEIADQYFEKSCGFGTDGYTARVDLYIKIIDCSYRLLKCEDRAHLFDKIANTWFYECFDKCWEIIDSVKLEKAYERYHENIDGIEANAFQVMGNIKEAVSMLKNMIGKTKDSHQTRRLLSTVYRRHYNGYSQIPQEQLKDIMNLMEENILDESEKAYNYQIWFNAARHCKEGKNFIDEVIHKLDKWSDNSNSIQPVFYCYVMNLLKAIEGSTINLVRCNSLLIKLRTLFNSGMYSPKPREFFVIGEGVSQIMNYRDLMLLSDKDKIDNLKQYTGKIQYHHPGKGIINCNDLEIFCQPGYCNEYIDTNNNPVSVGIGSESDGHAVRFSFGVGYDGPRAINGSVRTEQFLRDININSSTMKMYRIAKNFENEGIELNDLEVGKVIMSKVEYCNNSYVNVVLDNCGFKGSIYRKKLDSNKYKFDHNFQHGDPLRVRILGYNNKHKKYELENVEE